MDTRKCVCLTHISRNEKNFFAADLTLKIDWVCLEKVETLRHLKRKLRTLGCCIRINTRRIWMLLLFFLHSFLIVIANMKMMYMLAWTHLHADQRTSTISLVHVHLHFYKTFCTPSWFYAVQKGQEIIYILQKDIQCSQQNTNLIEYICICMSMWHETP